DASLYDGFVNDADRSRCSHVLQQMLSGQDVREMDFEDGRLHELLWRLRARRNPDALKVEEQERWRSEVRARLSGAPTTSALAAFRAALEMLPATAVTIRTALEAHANAIEHYLGGAMPTQAS
ncbi:MAG: hypothetical protein HC809_16135, partial [Gammaproteobacteria bacterium]|nr:hypothetical protein [Gammaproteobacteria bacterium]